jgi:hypothetical protein
MSHQHILDLGTLKQCTIRVLIMIQSRESWSGDVTQTSQHTRPNPDLARTLGL